MFTVRVPLQHSMQATVRQRLEVVLAHTVLERPIHRFITCQQVRILEPVAFQLIPQAHPARFDIVLPCKYLQLPGCLGSASPGGSTSRRASVTSPEPACTRSAFLFTLAVAVKHTQWHLRTPAPLNNSQNATVAKPTATKTCAQTKNTVTVPQNPDPNPEPKPNPGPLYHLGNHNVGVDSPVELGGLPL